jgi:glycogen debranching enzyme
MLRGVDEHLREAGLGQVSEIFDGDAPHSPRGCFAQAWSVAEILRALCEDVYEMGAG